MNPKQLWSVFLSLVLDLSAGFTHPGRRRFVELVTSLILNVEEHTITQSLVGIERPEDWKALESFAEYGSWNLQLFQSRMNWTIGKLPNALWHGYRVWAGDDTKVHRNSATVWGTCTFHEYSARCPNRAATVRAHNWVVIGGLQPVPNEPAMFLPVAGQLYFRKGQLPEGEVFRTKCELLVEMLRQQAKNQEVPYLAVFDGGFALASVVRPLVHPKLGQRRIEFITRLRVDARLCALPPTQRREHQRGRLPKWGPPLAPPRQAERWSGDWRKGRAFLYGRCRKVKWKEVICLWRVSGYDVKVKAVVAEVEGFSKRFTLVTSALDLNGLQVLELFCARYRQEDGFRDLKQRLGWEECRAWTKNPIVRTTQAVFMALTLLRLLQRRLEETVGEDWWLHPPWNPAKTRPSVRDVGRLMRQNQAEILQCLSDWLRTYGKSEGLNE